MGFLQVKRRAPDFELKEYKGMQRRQGGVISMLEVIESDFARLDADTSAAEAQAVEQYRTFVQDSERDLQSKHDAEFKLSLEKDQAEFEKGQLEKDLESTQRQ